MDIALKLIWIPLVAAGATQGLKILIRLMQSGRLEFGLVTHYGGMPSGHTAYVAGLVTVIGLAAGIESPVFAVAVAFAVITVRDAVSFRQYLSRYGRVLNHLLREHPKESVSPLPERIEERLGHTPFQALVGGTIGVALSWLLWVLLQ